MKAVFRFANLLLLLVATGSLWLSGCSQNNTDGPANPAAQFALATVAGAYPSQTTYLQGLPNLDATTINNSKAIESSNFASMYNYKNAVYLGKFGAPATLTKYTFDQTGKAVEAGRLVVPGANTFSTVVFVSETEAYASVGGGLAKLIKFNPTTFTATGEVDLSKLIKAGAASIYYLGAIQRDTKLYWGVHYFNKSFDSLTDSAYVAVIDLPTSKVEKVIADGRTAAIFSAGTSVSCFVKDANGDIYVQGDGTANVPSGVLRIPNGQTAFDPAYYLNLKAATGKDCKGLYGFGNGLAFTCRIEDASDPYESKGPNYHYYKLNLTSKTSTGALPNLPLVYGSGSSIMQQFDNQTIVFSVASATENALYQHQVADGSVSKKTGITGMCTGLAKLL